MKKVLITGGAGFIGANFVHHWIQNHPEDLVVVIDKLTYAGNPENLSGLDKNPNYHFVEGDICDEKTVAAIFEKHDIDTVVNFAAESHVDRSIEGSAVFVITNVLGTHNLLNVAKKYWLDGQNKKPHRFHHVSTDEVYGTLSPTDPSFKESNRYEPNSPYAASKASADHFVRAFHETYGLNVTVSNCSNNYGPYHFPEKLIPLCLLNIFHGKALPIYGDGQQVRDWLHVSDHCRGIDAVITKGKNGESYNIGGHDGETTNLNLVNLLCDLVDEAFAADPSLAEKYPNAKPATGKSSKELITHVTDRLGHDRRYSIDATKIKNELGFSPQVDLSQGLKETVQWYLNNEAWWQALTETAAIA